MLAAQSIFSVDVCGKTDLSFTLMYHKKPVPNAVPDWDAKNPAESFKVFADSLHEKARQVFLQDKTHIEIVFFLPLTGKPDLAVVKHNDKDKLASWLRQYINQHQIYGVIHIAECWTRAGVQDHMFMQIMMGEIAVSELKEEHRTEALSVIAQSRSGYSVLWIDEIVREESGKVSLKPSVIFSGIEGRFGKLFE